MPLERTNRLKDAGRRNKELLATVRRELFSCVLDDIMDTKRLTYQHLPPAIRP